jgi:hypothetical protein
MLQDADGKISMDEFKNACLGHEQFSKMLALKVLYFIIISSLLTVLVRGRGLKCHKDRRYTF